MRRNYVLYIQDEGRFEIFFTSHDRGKLEAVMDDKLRESEVTSSILDSYNADYDLHIKECKAIVKRYFDAHIDAIEFPHKNEMICRKTQEALIKKFQSNFQTCFEEPLCLYLNRDKLSPFPELPKWTRSPPKGFVVSPDHIHIMEIQEI